MNYAKETAPDLRKDVPRDVLQREWLPATRKREKPRGGGGISVLKMEQKCSFKFDKRHGCFLELGGGGVA